MNTHFLCPRGGQMKESEIRDIMLAEEGSRRISWAETHMPALGGIRARFRAEKPLKGLKVSLSIHLEAKTANLAIALREAGADVAVTGCNPLSTQDEVAAALCKTGFPVYAWHGAAPEEYERHLLHTLDIGPDIVIDDGGDLVHLLHGSRSELAAGVIGGCEETTTGVRRLRRLEAEGKLKFPMVAVNDADCKHLFDNRYGTGQSAWDGIVRTTNLLVAGKIAVIAGYGWCGRGLAARAKGLGADVVITEVDPVRALEAAMDGFRVMPMAEAAAIGEIFVTATGCRGVIRREHLAAMKDGALLANAGHFDVEIDKEALEALAVKITEPRRNIQGYEFADGRTFYLLGEGRLVNLACADGHPVEIMDMSFAIQALYPEYLVKNRGKLAKRVYAVPREVDMQVARVRLEASGIRMDSLDGAQREYLGEGD
jgi:adenosylhomocysteinase